MSSKVDAIRTRLEATVARLASLLVMLQQSFPAIAHFFTDQALDNASYQGPLLDGSGLDTAAWQSSHQPIADAKQSLGPNESDLELASAQVRPAQACMGVREPLLLWTLASRHRSYSTRQPHAGPRLSVCTASFVAPLVFLHMSLALHFLTELSRLTLASPRGYGNCRGSFEELAEDSQPGTASAAQPGTADGGRALRHFAYGSGAYGPAGSPAAYAGQSSDSAYPRRGRPHEAYPSRMPNSG